VREAAVVPPPPPAPTLPDYVWDGTAADNFAGGTGTEEDPFIIETPEQLYKMVKEYSTRTASLGKFFKLANDIYLNDVQDGTSVKDLAYKQNWLSEYGSAIAYASKENSFAGTFDGNNHTVYGLHIQGVSSAGLFPATSSGVTIKNLAVNNAYITGGAGYAGGIAGQLIYVDWTKSNNFVSCSVVNSTIGENGNFSQVGGLVGNTESCSVTFKNCYSYDLTLKDSGTPGGITGNAWASGGTVKLENCYTAGNFPTRNNIATSTYINVYTDTPAAQVETPATVTILANAHMKGDFAKTYMSGLDFERTFKTVENGYPVHFVYVRPANVWDGKIADSFAGGSGTAEDPYLIENGGQLYKMVAEFSNQTVTNKPTTRPYFRITKDIDLGYNQWYTINVTSWIDNAAYTTIGFNGVIYGDGHTIKGLNNEKTAGAVGLIPVAAQGAEIHNLHLDGGKLPQIAYNTYAVGAFIGFGRGASNATPVVIKGCSVKNFEISAANGAAAFVGYAYSLSVGIYNSYCADTTISVSAATSSNAAAFIGYTGGNDWLNTIKIANSYAAKVNPVPYLNANFKKITTFTNVYTDYDSYDNSVAGLTKLSTDKMQGEAAKTYMQGFEFGYAWQTVENGYPVHLLYVKPDYVWDGGTASSFAGGSGTYEDPFIIKTGAQLYKMVSEYSNASGASGTINKQYYFRLANDIYLNDVKAADMQNTTEAHWASKFNTWYSQTSYSKGFCGDLDGAGYTVYGLYANKGYAGLIPVLMDGGNIHNLNLKNSYVYGTESAGGLVGFIKAHWTMSPVSISYCTVDNIAVESGKIYVGGIAGGCADIKATLTDCSVTRAKLTSTNENANYVSAFIGHGWGNIVNEVTNCFTDSTVHPVSLTANTEAYGNLAARYSFTNVYTAAKKQPDVKGIIYVTEDSLKGNTASATLKGFDFTLDWQTAENDFPVIRKGAGNWRFDTSLPGEVWSGKLAAAYASGDGSKESPYEIKTGGQLALLANDAINGKTFGRYYIITADIVLNNTAKENWTANANEWFVGSWDQAFRGHLNGNYHIISGLYLNKTSENYSGSKYYGGLFAAISKNAVIEKLGIVDSSLTFTHATATKYLGAFAGFVAQYNGAETPYEEYPLIRECFADTTVTLNGGSCGEFIGCATRPIRIEDSFFTGKVGSATRGLFGYSKMNNDYGVVLVKNFYAADSKYAILSNTSYDNFRYENCYSSSAQDSQGVTRLFIDRMCGKNAAEYMLGFDFNKVWAIRADNETPGLKGFNQKAFSNEMNPEDITISFETNCDLVVEPMVGKAYSKLTLPVLEREGYTFEGWYSYAELDTPYTFDYFPTFNIILYAKWSLNGLSQDFENYEDTVYDYHEGIEYYRPTTEGYTAKYVRSGAKSMHRIAGGSDYRDFLLFYNQELEIGKTYKMVYYTTTDMENAAIDVSLVHLDWPDVYTAANGIVPMGTIENLTDGKWVENTFTFVAKSKWIAIRTEGDASIYFDDFTLYSTSDKADDALSGAAAGFFGSTLGIVLTVAAAAVVLGGAGAAIFFVARRKK
ncbi:MAG: InlB B-repeat-containing protein, partial [Clostridia bacterium]|nr:InlB B-repeat-containing protein [Clostridia bacterium]